MNNTQLEDSLLISKLERDLSETRTAGEALANALKDALINGDLSAAPCALAQWEALK